MVKTSSSPLDYGTSHNPTLITHVACASFLSGGSGGSLPPLPSQNNLGGITNAPSQNAKFDAWKGHFVKIFPNLSQKINKPLPPSLAFPVPHPKIVLLVPSLSRGQAVLSFYIIFLFLLHQNLHISNFLLFPIFVLFYHYFLILLIDQNGGPLLALWGKGATSFPALRIPPIYSKFLTGTSTTVNEDE